MFKDYNSVSLKEDQIISELQNIQNLGWEVYKKKPNKYIIRIDDQKEIELHPSSENWFICSKINGSAKFVKYANSIETLNPLLLEAGKSLSIDLKIERQIKSIRIRDNEPLTNKAKLISLIKTSSISKIFDPYFDLKSLITITSLKKLGLNLENKIECLTTKNLSIFDQTVLNDFKTECNTSIEVKKCENKEHRRFIILNDNRVIIIGCSLNDINKNEVINEELFLELKLADIKFFNDEWLKT
jgi:hypothetical protein